MLRDSHIPNRLPHREAQIRQVAEVLAPALRGDLPSNLLIYGKIGTGKTAVVAQVRQDMQRRAEASKNLSFVTVNCGNIDTAYSLLQTIGNTYARTEAERIPTGWSLDRVQAGMRRLMDVSGGTILLVLDEIDRLVARSGDSVLYTLSQLNTELETSRLVLIGISNDLKFTNHLDARVRSRLNEEKILFPPYDALQLQDILRERSREAFKDGVIDPGVVERCAAYAALENGDARRALALLRLAAEMAERDKAKRITPDHVVKAKNRLEQDIIVDCCRTLPPHCKVLLYAILQSYERRRTGVLTGEVYDSYRRLAERLGLQPLHARSISNYVSELETLGLIRATIVSRGRGGRTREIIVDVPISETMPALEEDPLLAPVGRPRTRGQMLLTNFDNPGRTGSF
ncbi:MAG: AAA family ATPase [Thermoplasmata archaeon]